MKATQLTFWFLRSPRFCRILFESLRVGKLETDSQSWQRFDSDGARVSISRGWPRYTPTFAQPSEKLIFMAPWRPDMQFAIQQLSTQVLNPTTESKRAVKQLIRYLKGTQHTCLRLEPREMVQTCLLEIVGRSDSDWAGDSATRQSAIGYRCNVQNVTMCNQSLKQTAISLSSCEAEFYAANACAGELLGLAELFKELHHDVAVRLFDGFRLGKTQSTAQGTRRTQNTSKYDAWQYNSGYERNVYP